MPEKLSPQVEHSVLMARSLALAQEVDPLTHNIQIKRFSDPLLPVLIRFPLETTDLEEAPQAIQSYLDGIDGAYDVDSMPNPQLQLAIKKDYFEVGILFPKEAQGEDEEPQFTVRSLPAESRRWALETLQERKKPIAYEQALARVEAAKEDRKLLDRDRTTHGLLEKGKENPILGEAYQVAAELTLVRMANILEPWAWALLYNPPLATPEARQLIAEYGYAVQQYSRRVVEVLESGILQTRETILHEFLLDCERREPGVPVSLARVAEALGIPPKKGQLASNLWTKVVELFGDEGLPPRVKSSIRAPKGLPE